MSKGRWGPSLLFALLAAVSVLYAAERVESEYKPLDIQNLPDFSGPFEEIADKLVRIKVLKYEKDEEGAPVLRYFTAGGVVLRSERLGDGSFGSKIITNYHVVNGAEKISVYLRSRQKIAYKAEVIGFDDRHDLALLRIAAPHELSSAVLGDSDKLKIGEWVFLVGNPRGFTWSLSVGFIGNLGKDPLLETIQFDGATNLGNSGGGLFNTKRELIGIPTMAEGNGTIGFAVSVNVVKKMLPALEEGGRVPSGFLGAVIEDFEVLMETPKDWGAVFREYGVVVKDVMKDMPAEKSGVLKGDIILELDGQKVESAGHFHKLSAESKIGKEIPLKILRGDKEMILSIIPVEPPLE